MSRPHSAPDVFRAIADPTRRRLLDLLRGGERTVTDLAQPSHMTMAAISQHLSVLRHARLVTQRRSGTRRLYRLDASKLREAYSWLTRYQAQWASAATIEPSPQTSRKRPPRSTDSKPEA